MSELRQELKPICANLRQGLLSFNKQIGCELEPLLHSILLQNYMSVAQAWMALEHLEQVVYLLAFGTDWRPWEWRRGPISTYKVGESLAHIFHLEKAPKKESKKCQRQSPKCADLSGPPVTIPYVHVSTMYGMY